MYVHTPPTYKDTFLLNKLSESLTHQSFVSEKMKGGARELNRKEHLFLRVFRQYV